MKIVIAADIYPPDIGGPATYADFLKKQLPTQDFQIELICYSDASGMDVVRISRSGPTLLRYARYAMKLYRLTSGAKVIYAMGPVSAGLPASWVARLRRIPLVVKVVGDYAWEQSQNRGVTTIGIDEFQQQRFSGKIGRLQQIERKVCRYAAKVIVPSQYLKKIVSSWGVGEEKIEVIYNAVLATSITPSKSVSATIISVGRLVPWKGFEALISLMPDLRVAKPDLKLEIYGSGPDQAKLEELIRRLRVTDIVSITKVDHQVLMHQLTNAAILVLNTGYEGFPHTVLEAMAAGTPVITTTAGGNPEIITDGENGLLVPYNSQGELKAAILRLFNDANLYERIVTNANQTWPRFSLETMLKRTINVLQSV